MCLASTHSAKGINHQICYFLTELFTQWLFFTKSANCALHKALIVVGVKCAVQMSAIVVVRRRRSPFFGLLF